MENSQFEVFYDSHCPMCRREIEMIRRKDKSDQILLTDMCNENFDPASTGKTLDQLMREIHGRYPDGTLAIGVDVFREIYSRLGFGWLVVPTGWPLIGPLMNLGYRFFARFRYASALKRFNRGHCDLPLKAFPERTSEETKAAVVAGAS